MNTTALVLMLVVQITVTVLAFYFFFRVLKSNKKRKINKIYSNLFYDDYLFNNKMSRNFKNFFSFSRKDRRGILVLLFIIILLICLNYLLPYFYTDKQYDFSDFKNKILEFEQEQKHLSDSINNKKNYKKILTPFKFDPNNLPVEKWKALGFDDKQINIIKNYESKGGKFYKKEDLKKIYGISDEDYKILKPYICIPKIIKTKKNKIIRKLTPFDFDPNNLPVEKWKALGFDDKQINIIKNYESKGGKFYKKEDLKKIYGITKNDYKILKPYIKIQNKYSKKTKEKTDSVNIKIEFIDINNADSSDLIKLRGIGPYFAKQIIKYRNLLGGFYKKEQLLEVYGMDSTRYLMFEKNIIINTENLKKFNVNKVKFKELLKHPYFDYPLVKSIFNYKNKHGNFKSLDELKNISLIYDVFFIKISPYLTVK